jgi:hypothetical protein
MDIEALNDVALEKAADIELAETKDEYLKAALAAHVALAAAVTRLAEIVEKMYEDNAL